MENVAEHYKDINPDVVVACLYDAGCGEWVRAQRAKGWSAKAEVLTVCVGSQAFSKWPQNTLLDTKLLVKVKPVVSVFES